MPDFLIRLRNRGHRLIARWIEEIPLIASSKQRVWSSISVWEQWPFFLGSRHCAAVLFSQVPKKCTYLHLSLLYILIWRTYSKFAWKNNFLALGVCFPRPCSSAGRKFAASRSRLQYYRRIILFLPKNDEMCWKLHSTENLRLFGKRPTPH